MKKIFFGCLAGLLAFSVANAQREPVPPAFYVDSQQVNFNNIYLDLNNISDINIQKGESADGKTNGRIYITLKVPFASFLTLEALSLRQEEFKDRKVLYMIDDSVVKDTSGVRIDPSYIASVRAVDVASIPYAGGSGEKLGILIIKTRKPEPVKSEGPQIRIRGAVAAN